MKKILLLFLLTGLMTACNNNPFAGNNRKANTRDKNESNDRDKNDAYDDDETKSSWTKKQRNKMMDDCLDELEDYPRSKQICSCALKKLEKKYPDYQEADEAIEGEGRKILKECGYDENKGNDDYNEDDFTSRDKDKNSSFEEDYYEWTPTQRSLYIDQCATAARQNISASKARSYCDCMQGKIEKKYRMSFPEANKINQADLSTPEMQADIQKCLNN